MAGSPANRTMTPEGPAIVWMMLASTGATAGAMLDTSEWLGPFGRALFFAGPYNTRIVVAGTVLLGIASGLLGTFLLLRKRSLLSDALGHAALPGVCAGFLIGVWLFGDGRSLAVLLPGAAVFGLLGAAAVQVLTTLPRVREDAAIGVVLSVFFAAGIVMLGVIQTMDGGGQAGLDRLIFGQAATMSAGEVRAMGIAAILTAGLCVIGFRQMRLLCFDPAFARSLGWSTTALDGVLLAGAVAVVTVGLYAVGAILIVALLIIPPAAARFWTDRLGTMLVIAAGIGGFGAWVGTAWSAVAVDLPTGPAIVVVCGGAFAVSMLAAPPRGVLAAAWRRRTMQRRMARQHLLRAMYETGEVRGAADEPIDLETLRIRRGWSKRDLARALRETKRQGDVQADAEGWRLTDAGFAAARAQTRRHRLWEHFLASHAEIDTSHVDRGADDIEHVLGRAMVDELEADLKSRGVLAQRGDVPDSPHRLDDNGPGTNSGDDPPGSWPR